MHEETPAGIAGIGALAEPGRRALYEYVAAQPDPVGREQAAAAVGIPVHSAKFHLDRLVSEGLLEFEFRRLSGRTGPGAGRPAKLYRRSATEFSVSLPERRYDLAGQILATAVDLSIRDGLPVDAVVRDVAVESGRDLGARSPRDKAERERTADVLSAQGYEPRLSQDEMVLANCPFDALAREHTALVCDLNQGFVEGVLDGLGCANLQACLDPEPGLCCVRVRSLSDQAGGPGR
ncbi:MAG: transcriptional regulator [Actinomycetota bacterium]|nr:transcriptional regulator [Actinomycetota bacterium]